MKSKHRPPLKSVGSLVVLLSLFFGASQARAAQKPTITANPASAVKCPGEAISFSVTATGTAPLHYQWQKNSNSIAGASASTYSIASVSAADAGSYRVVVTNVAGTATSAGAT